MKCKHKIHQQIELKEKMKKWDHLSGSSVISELWPLKCQKWLIKVAGF